MLTAGITECDHEEDVPGRPVQATEDPHSDAVLRSFYDFWIEAGGGPPVNPVPLARSDRRRP
ncbi:hypothetical protein [Streptomyces sp. NPDC085540]|uniref:hypothetical protein n=1 Tax=Streptomyces sp. NPDC085540 TaxID=3365730 RepID=UPI0037D18B6D